MTTNCHKCKELEDAAYEEMLKGNRLRQNYYHATLEAHMHLLHMNDP